MDLILFSKKKKKNGTPLQKNAGYVATVLVHLPGVHYHIFHFVNVKINRNVYLKIPIKNYLSKFKEIDKKLASLFPFIQGSVYSRQAEGKELLASQPAKGKTYDI